MFRIKASYADQLELRTTVERAREFFGELRNFADLMPGSGHGIGGYVNVGRIEVFGNPVKR